jgi:hypothetical protein
MCATGGCIGGLVCNETGGSSSSFPAFLPFPSFPALADLTSFFTSLSPAVPPANLAEYVLLPSLPHYAFLPHPPSFADSTSKKIKTIMTPPMSTASTSPWPSPTQATAPSRTALSTSSRLALTRCRLRMMTEMWWAVTPIVARLKMTSTAVLETTICLLPYVVFSSPLVSSPLSLSFAPPKSYLRLSHSVRRATSLTTPGGKLYVPPLSL